MAYNTILWPTDLSQSSLQALKHVEELAAAHEARVVVLYVGLNLCGYFPAYGNYPGEDQLREFHGWELEHARKKLEEICSKGLSACPSLTVRVTQGDPATEILKAITAENADLVVMTTRGSGSDARGTETPSLGTVAAKVMVASPVPVQLVNP